MSVAYGILLSGNGGILPSGITLFGSQGWLYGRLGEAGASGSALVPVLQG